MSTKLFNILFFLLGALTGFLVHYYLQQPCPEYSGRYETISIDTTFDIKTNGRMVPAWKKESTKDGFELATKSRRDDVMPAYVVPDSCIIVEAHCENHSQYTGHLHDSSIAVDVTAYLSGRNCKVDSFFINYNLPVLTIRQNERLVPETPIQKAQIFLLMQPNTDGTRNGLSVGLLRLRSRYIYGAGFDPFSKRVQVTGGIKIW